MVERHDERKTQSKKTYRNYLFAKKIETIEQAEVFRNFEDWVGCEWEEVRRAAVERFEADISQSQLEFIAADPSDLVLCALAKRQDVANEMGVVSELLKRGSGKTLRCLVENSHFKPSMEQLIFLLNSNDKDVREAIVSRENCFLDAGQKRRILRSDSVKFLKVKAALMRRKDFLLSEGDEYYLKSLSTSSSEIIQSALKEGQVRWQAWREKDRLLKGLKMEECPHKQKKAAL
jgi:hypothetical protein